MTIYLPLDGDDGAKTEGLLLRIAVAKNFNDTKKEVLFVIDIEMNLTSQSLLS